MPRPGGCGEGAHGRGRGAEECRGEVGGLPALLRARDGGGGKAPGMLKDVD